MISRRRARLFADELIPLEAGVELAGGELPPDQEAEHKARAIELGLIRVEHAQGGRRRRVHVPAAGPDPGAGRPGHQRSGLGGRDAAVLAARRRHARPDGALRQALLRAASGSECYAITEEGAGSDVDAIEATASRDGDDYVLNGMKWHVTSFNAADYAFFQGKLTSGDHVGEHAMFLVDLPSPGVRVVRTPAYMHTLGHGAPAPDRGVRGRAGSRRPARRRRGRRDELRLRVVQVRAADGRCPVPRRGRAADRRDDLVRSRSASSPDGRSREFGAVQAMLADSLTELFAARSLTYETARGIDAGADVKVQHAQCSMAKLYAAEMAGRVADRAVQVFGGRGYMREYAAERFYRELRVERIWEGTSEVQRAIIADQMIKRGPGSPEPCWPGGGPDAVPLATRSHLPPAGLPAPPDCPPLPATRPAHPLLAGQARLDRARPPRAPRARSAAGTWRCTLPSGPIRNFSKFHWMSPALPSRVGDLGQLGVERMPVGPVHVDLGEHRERDAVVQRAELADLLGSARLLARRTGCRGIRPP